MSTMMNSWRRRNDVRKRIWMYSTTCESKLIFFRSRSPTSNRYWSFLYLSVWDKTIGCECLNNRIGNYSMNGKQGNPQGSMCECPRGRNRSTLHWTHGQLLETRNAKNELPIVYPQSNASIAFHSTTSCNSESIRSSISSALKSSLSPPSLSNADLSKFSTSLTLSFSRTEPIKKDSSRDAGVDSMCSAIASFPMIISPSNVQCM
mmetsp:Transcript_5890/g.22342  ORF Transcript_5890/g.22342 Transcript_5890/m.22342 type:complete len:205 (-) Transcript_5890:4728-5342(-)